MDDTNTTPAKPVLPDGIGLTIEDTQMLLMQAHNKLVDAGDPWIMMITILNAHLCEVDKLMKLHTNAINTMLENRTTNHVRIVEQMTAELGKSLSESALNNFRHELEETTNAMNQLRTHHFWLTGIIALAALVNVTVFFLRG